MMHVWLVKISEPLPLSDLNRSSLDRMGLIAEALLARDHTVTWWTSSFHHGRKEQQFAADTTVRVGSRYALRILRTPGYPRNVGLLRALDHWWFDRRLSCAIAQEHALPDLIVAALPTVEASYTAVQFGRAHGIPVVLDLRDMWPDIIADMVSPVLRPIVRLGLIPSIRQVKHACSGATALTGITDGFVDWGLGHGARCRGKSDRAFPLGTSLPSVSDEEMLEADLFWGNMGIGQDGYLNVCFLGVLGGHAQQNLGPVIAAARRLGDMGRCVRFILCGRGEESDRLKHMSIGASNVVFPGWVGAARLRSLLARSHVGLDPLPNRRDFMVSINTKAIEYLRAGLPVLCCPKKGSLYEMLMAEDCGLGYDAGSVDSLVNVIRQFDDDRDMLSRMSAKAKRLYDARFDQTIVYSAMAEYLEEIQRNGYEMARNGRREGV